MNEEATQLFTYSQVSEEKLIMQEAVAAFYHVNCPTGTLFFFFSLSAGNQRASASEKSRWDCLSPENIHEELIHLVCITHANVCLKTWRHRK